MRNIKRTIAAVIVSAAAMTFSAADAATMNFDALPDEGAGLTTYKENGITANALGGVLGFFNNPGFAHIDDSGTGFAFGADFTMVGLFDAVSFSLVSFGFNFFERPGPLAGNLFVSGYLGDTQVGSASFALGDAFTAQSFTLGSAFAGISRLRIELLYPISEAFCDAPCSHFDLDSVTLNAVGIAPVPLPPSLALTGAAGIGLWGLRRRRRVSARA